MQVPVIQGKLLLSTTARSSTVCCLVHAFARTYSCPHSCTHPQFHFQNWEKRKCLSDTNSFFHFVLTRSVVSTIMHVFRTQYPSLFYPFRVFSDISSAAPPGTSTPLCLSLNGGIVDRIPSEESLSLPLLL